MRGGLLVLFVVVFLTNIRFVVLEWFVYYVVLYCRGGMMVVFFVVVERVMDVVLDGFLCMVLMGWVVLMW